MKDKLDEIKNDCIDSLNDVTDVKGIEELRSKLVGKKSEFTEILRSMGSLSADERPKAGKLINEAREYIESLLDNTKKTLTDKEVNLKLTLEEIDVTMPGKIEKLGKKHPMTQVTEDLIQIFIGMGYEVAEGPEVETEYYNFEALNIEKNHPARDEQDTFYIEGGFLLRTQTSPVQVRKMEEGNLPIRIIAPGRVFRSDQVDATHSPVFHQLEGLVIDENISMADLKGSLEVFAKELFGKYIKVRFRPHHFPFTEPSAEMDVSCFACNGSGCRVCKDSGWIEILGCGMVHPKVLKMSGIDPDNYSGFAFGMGLERIAMQKYGINDLRLMYENDIRFLGQF